MHIKVNIVVKMHVLKRWCQKRQNYMMQLLYLTCLLYVRLLSPAKALDNGLALTPPMGWLSWLWLGCNIDCEHHPTACLSEDVIKSMADRMAAEGYKDAGYEYIIIDDCWLESKRENGKLIPDKKRFKSGMKALADYIHSKGLKFGMYEDIGMFTCQHAPGLKGHEKVDVATFVEWGIDYLKVDGCYENHDVMNQSYPAFGKLLNESGRPILYSCSWPAYVPGKDKDYTAISKNCNIWRNYGDIGASWGSVANIMDWFGSQPWLAGYAGPGHFHDPDMLVIGNPGVTVDQARVQMAVWAILAAPLLMSTDLASIRPEFKEILLNKDIISVNQCHGLMGMRITDSDNLEIWRRHCKGEWAIAFVNKDTKEKTISVKHEDLHINNADYKVTDFYKEDKNQDFPKGASLSVKINPTGVKFYRFVHSYGTDDTWIEEKCPDDILKDFDSNKL